MEANWNQLIERYLNNELSAEGKSAFEAELERNKELQRELELHQLTIELIQRNSLRTLVEQSGKWYQLKKKIIIGGISLLIGVALVTSAYFISEKFRKSVTEKEKIGIQSATQKNEKALFSDSIQSIYFTDKYGNSKRNLFFKELEKYLAFANIPAQYFEFTGQPDVFLSKTGVLLSLTEKSFLQNGQPYSGKAIIQWQEAQTPSDFAKAGLSTKAGNQLLETQGMFNLNAFTPDGKKLELSKEGAYIQVPGNEVKEGMKLFQGVSQPNGDVDWQNPVELERLPRQKKMSEIDLYPCDYEPKLNELKWETNKKKRDSLYLSFENFKQTQGSFHDELEEVLRPVLKKEENPYEDKILLPIKINNVNVTWNFSVEYLENNEAYIVATVKITDGWFLRPSKTDKKVISKPQASKLNSTLTKMFLNPNGSYEQIREFVDENSTVIYKKGYEGIPPGEAIFKQKIKILSQEEFSISGNCISNEFSYKLEPSQFEYPFEVTINRKNKTQKYIPPSKVLAIWNSKFDGTNLATQDFEDRMKLIHETCDEQLLNLYTNNLNESLWKLDERAVAMGYPQFQQFANQRTGKVSIDDVHQKNLNAFYETAVKEIRNMGQKNFEEALKKELKWDNEVQNERIKEVVRKGMRESVSLEEEYNFNHKNVRKQLGFTAGFRMTTNIVNIDRYVREATIARKTTEITNPYTGETAQITYNPLSAEVKNAAEYGKLYIYLFSKEINSYQRLDFENGKLNYRLNGDMNYSAMIIGINDNGYFYHQINSLKAENLGIIALKEISEREFDTRINQLNNRRTEQPMGLTEELQWLFKEKANYEVQKQRKKDGEFRAMIRPIVFPCGIEMEIMDEAVPVNN